MSVSVHSHMAEVVSLLHGPVVIATENLIPGYDVLTGKHAVG